ncbi:MAG: YHS domain-containing (seleno)protein [Xenococcaceae cyanobacterium MO_188.B29]|nr:YHS domain-containing (seleno)protein [Xenococcaceae cyanobacterium MO_188.B29]
MKLKYLIAATTASIITLGFVGISQNWNTATANPCAAQVNPCASKNPCAGVNPCASKNPCAGVNPCASKNPCAGANPCAGKTKSAPQVYTESQSGLAIRGTDPVAYFTQGKAIKGSNQYEYEWQGATWRFSSAENMRLFASNPETYAPQYGGYCAKGLSEGNVVSTDPNAWKIVDGKLYLNYSPQVQRQWLRDVPGNIAKADSRWPNVLIGATVFE